MTKKSNFLDLGEVEFSPPKEVPGHINCSFTFGSDTDSML